MKRCSTCLKIKSIDNFAHDKNRKDGRYPQCKKCKQDYDKEYRAKNKLKLKAYNKEYESKNAEKIRIRKQKYRNKNKDKINSRLRVYEKQRRKSDPLYKLKDNVRRRILKAFEGQGFTKNGSSQELLGCTFKELKSHIEKQFKTGMSWELMGKYIHIDHIIPLASAKTEDEIKALCHYTNLQPLWAKENLKKRDKIL